MAIPLPAVRWARFGGTLSDVERDRIRGSKLYTLGDAILVWVNEGDILLHPNMDQTPAELLAENNALRDAIEDLRKVWFEGTDLNKDAISQRCLKLFKVANDPAIGR